MDRKTKLSGAALAAAALIVIEEYQRRKAGEGFTPEEHRDVLHDLEPDLEGLFDHQRWKTVRIIFSNIGRVGWWTFDQPGREDLVEVVEEEIIPAIKYLAGTDS